MFSGQAEVATPLFEEVLSSQESRVQEARGGIESLMGPCPFNCIDTFLEKAGEGDFVPKIFHYDEDDEDDAWIESES
jgi:hypothetical protein